MRLHNRKLLLKLMAIQGVSTRALALAIGYKSHAHLACVLRGEISTLPVDRAVRIAHYFQIGVDDLFMVTSSSGTGDNLKRASA